MGTAAYHPAKLEGGTGCLTPGKGQPMTLPGTRLLPPTPSFAIFAVTGARYCGAADGL